MASPSAVPSPQCLFPYLGYQDAEAAITFLCTAFGFEERFRVPMPDGRIGHCELAYRGNVLMLASAYPELGLMSPRDLPGVSALIVCNVEDVDAHFKRARAAGATIINEPENQEYGDRSYRVVDPEGHRFIFSMPIAAAKDADPDPDATS